MVSKGRVRSKSGEEEEEEKVARETELDNKGHRMSYARESEH